MTLRSQCRRGATMIEFTLVGIPILFALISIFEISRGMWMYVTLTHAVKTGVRYASVHGINCVNTANNPNNCAIAISDIAGVIQYAGVGLDPNSTTLTFTPSTTNTPCTLGTSCATNKSLWPPHSDVGISDFVGQPITITAKAPFNTALSMFWPGSKPMQFGSVTLGAYSNDYIQF